MTRISTVRRERPAFQWNFRTTKPWRHPSRRVMRYNSFLHMTRILVRCTFYLSEVTERIVTQPTSRLSLSDRVRQPGFSASFGHCWLVHDILPKNLLLNLPSPALGALVCSVPPVTPRRFAAVVAGEGDGYGELVVRSYQPFCLLCA